MSDINNPRNAAALKYTARIVILWNENYMEKQRKQLEPYIYTALLSSLTGDYSYSVQLFHTAIENIF